MCCGDGKGHSHSIKNGKLLRKVCTKECVLFLLTLGSVAPDTHTHTTRLTGLHGWHDRVTCCDLKHVTHPNYSTAQG